jgi:E3 ubiquitin-protein ligase AMFR
LLESAETFLKYGLHLHRCDTNWEARGVLIYFTEFFVETFILLLTLGHYGQLLFSLGVSLSIVNVVLFFNIRYIFVSLRERVYSLKNYLKLAYAMKSRYPDVSKEELEQLDDYCAICRDPMESAKKLPCNHIFHQSCLRGWLEQHHSCPTCRFSLIDARPENLANDNLGAQNVNPDNNPHDPLLNEPGVPLAQEPAVVAPRQDPAPVAGWRDWFVRPGNGVTRNMIRTVQEVAPHIPEQLIERDLARTRSIDLTLENILEGRLVAPEEQVPPHVPQVVAPPVQPIPQPQPMIPIPNAMARSEMNADVETPVVSLPVHNFDSELIEPPAGFASSPAERERVLQARKALLKQQARL